MKNQWVTPLLSCSVKKDKENVQKSAHIVHQCTKKDEPGTTYFVKLFDHTEEKENAVAEVAFNVLYRALMRDSRVSISNLIFDENNKKIIGIASKELCEFKPYVNMGRDEKLSTHGSLSLIIF
ncbi:MAG: hypothetical protein EP298_05360 [Gammaproteobacteria bacterium]|nr:MAG: hypothetical protein EP298_05360 [Gammaproteobacteria bacterium]UTW43249.1 hypothetical protein KFE69_03645 [bacterium SCSIO 12844]